MKNRNLLTLLCLCLGSTPLWALKGKENDTEENPKPVAAAARPSASQTTTPAAAKAAPRKVVIQRPKPFILNAKTLAILQSTARENAEKKEALLEHAARADDLKIQGCALPNDTTGLMLPFVNVRSLELRFVTDRLRVVADDLPLLPCPEKLKSLMLTRNAFQAIQNITSYINLRTLWFVDKPLEVTDPHRNQTDRLGALIQLHNLREFHCFNWCNLGSQVPADSALLIRILESNPDIEVFTCDGVVGADVARALAKLPLHRLSFQDSEIDNDTFALLPFGTLEEFKLCGSHTLTSLAPLQGSLLRVFQLNNQENLGDTLSQVVCSMPNLKELDLRFCRLTDAQAEPLLQRSQTLCRLKLDSSRISVEMRQRLKEMFGDRVTCLTIPRE